METVVRAGSGAKGHAKPPLPRVTQGQGLLVACSPRTVYLHKVRVADGGSTRTKTVVGEVT